MAGFQPRPPRFIFMRSSATAPRRCHSCGWQYVYSTSRDSAVRESLWRWGSKNETISIKTLNQYGTKHQSYSASVHLVPPSWKVPATDPCAVEGCLEKKGVVYGEKTQMSLIVRTFCSSLLQPSHPWLLFLYFSERRSQLRGGEVAHLKIETIP